MPAIGTERLCRPVRKHFRCWRLTGGVAARPILLSLTRKRHSVAVEINVPSRR
jgi:hypothetical protein